MTNVETMPETWTTRETAKLLGASVRTIQLWVEDGRLKAWKTPGGHRRVLRSSVEEMLLSRRRASGSERRKYGVLLLGEDAAQVEILGQALANLGLDTHLRTSVDGYEALIRIGEACPDLLVVDLHLSGLDGFRFLNTVTRESSRRPAQIIALTTLSPEEMIARGGLPVGVMPLTKPVRAAALLSLAKACYTAWQAGGN